MPIDDVICGWLAAHRGARVLGTASPQDHALLTELGVEPCDYRDNDLERYYPVKTADGANEAIYGRYKELAAGDSERLTFIGRCGTYRYLDMDVTIAEALAAADGILAAVDAGRAVPSLFVDA